MDDLPDDPEELKRLIYLSQKRWKNIISVIAHDLKNTAQLLNNAKEGPAVRVRVSRHGVPLSARIRSNQPAALVRKNRLRNLEIENEQLTQQLVTTGVHLAINRQARIQLQEEEKKRKVEQEKRSENAKKKREKAKKKRE